MIRACYPVLLGLLLNTLHLVAQSPNQPPKAPSNDAVAHDKRDKADADKPWQTQCTPTGCILTFNVLRGDSDDPPDAKDLHQYISIAVTINKQDKRPALVLFQLTPNAQQDKGLSLEFTQAAGSQGKPDGKADSDGAIAIPFRECNQESCTAVVMNAEIDRGGQKIDLLSKLIKSQHLSLLYISNGHPYRTMISLAQFKKEYARVLRDDFKPESASPSK